MLEFIIIWLGFGNIIILLMYLNEKHAIENAIKKQDVTKDTITFRVYLYIFLIITWPYGVYKVVISKKK